MGLARCAVMAFGSWKMNTRLQVEHPVTEMVTGLDLVELQLRVASGEALNLRQEDIQLQGWAFEARVYAEDASKGFLPATGTLEYLSFPVDARADTGVRSGDTISPFYDPMIAKLVVHGSSRAVALSRLQDALAKTRIVGTTTNVAFLQQLASQSDFASGRVDTGLIARHQDILCEITPLSDAILACAALCAMGLPKLEDDFSGFHLWTPLRQSVQFTHLDDTFEAVVVTRAKTLFDVILDDSTVTVSFDQGVWVDGLKTSVELATTASGFAVFADKTYEFRRIDPLETQTGDRLGGNKITVPMPGLIKQVLVSKGDNVVPGEALAMLEAMKMEHRLLAERDGVVDEVLVQAGDQVEEGAVVILLQELE